MVVTAHYLATQAGVRMLEEGGNAVDAAVAASLALAVCEPAGSGLGGMAIMLLHDPVTGRVRAIPGPCRAPALATPEAVAGIDRYRGYGAAAVPTLVAVLRGALARYGSLPERAVLAPSIALAEEGYPRSTLQEALVAEFGENLRGPLRDLFLDEAGRPHAAGSSLRQPALVATLRKLERRGLEDFHRGGLAREIAADMEAHGGFVRLSDLEAAADPRETEPIEGRFEGETVTTTGPPGGGLALLQMLQMLDAAGAADLDPDEPEWSVLIARIIRRARRDRRRYRLRTGAEELGEAAELLEPGANRDAVRMLTRDLGRSGETSHICTMDADGFAVSMTQSIERSFGAGVAAAKLGFLYNGYLRAFKVKNQRHPHYLVPGAPARSNAAPAMVLSGGRPRVVVGSTGSERGTSGILQVLARLPRQSPFEASHAPRLHCTPEGEVPLELDRFAPAARLALTEAGMQLAPLDPYSFTIGGLQLIVRDGDGLTGVSEPRRDGAAAGPRDGVAGPAPG